jgi:hypothetical protein
MSVSPERGARERGAPAAIVYSPELDPVGAEEAEMAARIAEAMVGVTRTTFEDGGRPLRAVHAKSHAIVKAELEVLGGLPGPLAQGVFARPARHPAVMRFSTIPGDLLPDSVSTPRGLALKLLGVEGPRLEGSEGATTQDFIMVNGPTFATKSPKIFLQNLKLVAATTDKAEGAKVALSTAARAVQAAAHAFGAEIGAIRPLGGEPPHHILGETYWTQLPLRHGAHVAKLQVAPASPELKALSGAGVDLGDGPDVLREAAVAFFREHEAEWELRAQLASDLDDTPIDDPTKEWTEDVAPFFTVARIRAARQTAWSEDRARAVDDGMAFRPWTGIEAHRPLGQMMRIRKVAYAASQRFRAEHGAPLREPETLNAIPD